MSLKKLLGDKYREDMTAEEINDILTNDIKVVSKDRFDEIASEISAKNKELKALQLSHEDISSKYSSLKAKTDENMTEAERYEQVIKESELKISELTAELSKKNVLHIFTKGGMTEEEQNTFLEYIDLSDTENAVIKAEKLVKDFNQRIEDRTNRFKEELNNNTPNPKHKADDKAGVVIKRYNDYSVEELSKLSQDNPEEYRRLYDEQINKGE